MVEKPPGLLKGTFLWYNEKCDFCEVENEENFILGRDSLNYIEGEERYLNLWSYYLQLNRRLEVHYLVEKEI